MNTKRILFLTLGKINSTKDSGIYNDLVEELSKHAQITVLCPHERRYGYKSLFITEENVTIYQQFTPNIQKTKKIEKVISTFLTEFLMIYAFIKNFRVFKYNTLIISTPPIFVYNFIKVLKFFNPEMKIYLLLKDIYPQNAVDLGMLNKKSFSYYISRNTEKKLYRIADKIGCMSQANIDYVKKHNPKIAQKLELNPNSINIAKYPNINRVKSINNRKTLNLVYGGNLGLPQDPILICNFIEKIETLINVKLTICGDGTGYGIIKKFIAKNNINKTIIKPSTNKNQYFKLLETSDIGLIFLNNSFTIPNYPSRVLDYLFFQLTFLTITDTATDLTNFIRDNNLGYCYTNKETQIDESITLLKNLHPGNLRAYDCEKILKENFNIEQSGRKILSF